MATRARWGTRGSRLSDVRSLRTLEGQSRGLRCSRWKPAGEDHHDAPGGDEHGASDEDQPKHRLSLPSPRRHLEPMQSSRLHAAFASTVGAPTSSPATDEPPPRRRPHPLRSSPPARSRAARLIAPPWAQKLTQASRRRPFDHAVFALGSYVVRPAKNTRPSSPPTAAPTSPPPLAPAPRRASCASRPKGRCV